MKKMFIWLIAICVAIPSFSQRLDSSQVTGTNKYLLKSQSQDFEGVALLAGGMAMIVGGVIKLHNHPDLLGEGNGFITGILLTSVGIGLSAGSISFFNKAKRNRKLAASMALSQQHIYYPLRSGFSRITAPTLSVKVTF